MKKTIDVKWQGGMAFNTILDGHKITVDAPQEVGGEDLGPRPKVLMLVALGGCPPGGGSPGLRFGKGGCRRW